MRSRRISQTTRRKKIGTSCAAALCWAVRAGGQTGKAKLCMKRAQDGDKGYAGGDSLIANQVQEVVRIGLQTSKKGAEQLGGARGSGQGKTGGNRLEGRCEEKKRY